MKKIQISPSILSADFSQLGNEIKKLLADEKFLHEVLKEGNIKADRIANNNLNKIYDKVGLLKFKQ